MKYRIYNSEPVHHNCSSSSDTFDMNTRKRSHPYYSNFNPSKRRLIQTFQNLSLSDSKSSSSNIGSTKGSGSYIPRTPSLDTCDDSESSIIIESNLPNILLEKVLAGYSKGAHFYEKPSTELIRYVPYQNVVWYSFLKYSGFNLDTFNEPETVMDVDNVTDTYTPSPHQLTLVENDDDAMDID